MTVIDAACIVCGGVYVTARQSVCLSVCLSHLSTAAAECGGFGAVDSSWCKDSGCFPPEVSESVAWNPMVRPSPKWWSTSADRSDFTVSSPIPSTHFGIWTCGLTWRHHTGKHGSSAPHQRITQPTSWPHVASPTWSSTEQVARRFHPSDWRPLETCCRPRTRSTQPCIPPGSSLNRVPASAGVKAGMSPLPGGR